MQPRSYYNEHDKFAADWLRMLILTGEIAEGDVDERSIEDVQPGDLRGYTQCHFFAGIGGWSRALRLAGWPDDRPVWTGSCPCQPFSAAGKGDGFADERHLWPAFNWLIVNCRPVCILGEQVASKPGLAWLDVVQADLEAADYSCGAVDICAAGIGAPHIRQRLYFGAYSQYSGQQRQQITQSGCLLDSLDAERKSRQSGSSCGPGFIDGAYSRCTDGTRRLTDRSGRSNAETGASSLAPVGERSFALNSPNSSGGFPGNGDLQRSREYGLLAPVGERSSFNNGVGTHAANSRLAGSEDSGSDRCYESAGIRSLESERDSYTLHRPNSAGRFASNGDLQRSGEYGLLAEAGGVGVGPDANGEQELAAAERRLHSESREHRESQHSNNPEQPRLERLSGDERGPGWLTRRQTRSIAEAGATRGFWRDADWWHGRDEKYRPIEPGLFPLVNGVSGRVGKLRGYGNAIVPPLAAEFIKAFAETIQ